MLGINIVRTGNDGNCYIITTDKPHFENHPNSIMVDCGGDKLPKNDYSDIGCICITHSHKDHVSALGKLLYGLAYKPIVIVSEGEYNAPITQRVLGIRSGKQPNVLFLEFEDDISKPILVGNFVVTACKAHHDSECPVHYFITDGANSVFVSCDTAYVDESTIHMMNQADAVLIEANHSKILVDESSDLSKAHMNEYGHLSNQQLNDVLPHLTYPKIICLTHINEMFNSYQNIKQEVGDDRRIRICLNENCPITTKIE